MSERTILILIIAVVLIIGLGISGYIYWNNWKKSKVVEKITESAIQGALPSLGINPLESKPDINPADKANPFKNIKTNPFE